MNGNFGYEDKRGNGGGYDERRGGKDAVGEFDVRGKGGGSDRGQRAVDRGGGSERRKGEGSERRGGGGGYGEERREGGDVRADFDARQRPFEPSEVRIPTSIHFGFCLAVQFMIEELLLFLTTSFSRKLL